MASRGLGSTSMGGPLFTILLCFLLYKHNHSYPPAIINLGKYCAESALLTYHVLGRTFASSQRYAPVDFVSCTVLEAPKSKAVLPVLRVNSCW